jgi:hypothetical protein
MEQSSARQQSFLSRTTRNTFMPFSSAPILEASFVRIVSIAIAFPMTMTVWRRIWIRFAIARRLYGFQVNPTLVPAGSRRHK